jgi:glycerophosphoryl diester phosphodiesterase
MQKQIPNTQIPTLDELFTLLETLPHPNAKTVKLNLEIKRDPRHPEFTEQVESLIQKIVTKVHQRGFSDRVYYSCFDPKVLSEIRKQDPNAILALIFEEQGLAFLSKITFQDPIELMIKVAKSFSASVLSPSYTLLDEKLVQNWQKAGFLVIPWTVNNPEDWQKCVEFGVDGIITDYPKELLNSLKN